MGWILRKAASFEPLRVTPSLTGQGASLRVRGVRVCVGPQGTYISMRKGAFSYWTKFNDESGSATALRTIPAGSGIAVNGPAATLVATTPDAVLAEIQMRSKRLNFFRGYVW